MGRVVRMEVGARRVGGRDGGPGVVGLARGGHAQRGASGAAGPRRSARDIRAGEELLFDYVNAFGEGALEQGVFEQIKSAG